MSRRGAKGRPNIPVICTVLLGSCNLDTYPVKSGRHRESTCLTVTPRNRSWATVGVGTAGVGRLETLKLPNRNLLSCDSCCRGHALCTLPHSPQPCEPPSGLRDCHQPGAVPDPAPPWDGNSGCWLCFQLCQFPSCTSSRTGLREMGLWKHKDTIP